MISLFSVIIVSFLPLVIVVTYPILPTRLLGDIFVWCLYYLTLVWQFGGELRFVFFKMPIDWAQLMMVNLEVM